MYFVMSVGKLGNVDVKLVNILTFAFVSFVTRSKRKDGKSRNTSCRAVVIACHTHIRL